MAHRFKAPTYVGRPNPVALAMRRLSAFGARRTPNKRQYNRAKLKAGRAEG